ncbi:MAG TPA: FAD-dependent oxidoreductase, partial [Vampirovibrionales bacterium]
NFILFLFLSAFTGLTATSSTLQVSNSYKTEVLVIGASQSGVSAAIQASRQGANVMLVSASEWPGGSITEAGVSAVDGNELQAFQTGLWGEFVARLAKKEENLLKYGWVSVFTFNPQKGKQLFEEWLAEENVIWLKNKEVKKILFDKQDNEKIVGVELQDGSVINAKVTIDATEKGDLLELANMDYKLGWEFKEEFNEASAPKKKSLLTKRYPLQELTWVFYIRDFGEDKAPKIQKPVGYSLEKAHKRYWCAFKNEKLIKESRSFTHNLFNPNWAGKYKQFDEFENFFNKETFLTYGQVAPDLFMINWPKCGNDYSLNIERYFSSDKSQQAEFLREARVQSLWFAKYIQDVLGDNFGLADSVFEPKPQNDFIPGFAYIPYNREVRRLIGVETFTENDLQPNLEEGERAKFNKDSIAIGNYANDHHYFEFAAPGSIKHYKLPPKSFKFGGRYTGTTFSIPYYSLIPATVDGLIVAEKSWSSSHVANGSTRLQPVCILVGQAAGSAAAIAAKHNIEPYDVNIKELQLALASDEIAAPTLVPLFDIKPNNPYRFAIQWLMLNQVIDFPSDGFFAPKEMMNKKDALSWLENTQLSLQDDLIDEMIDLTREEAAYKLFVVKYPNLKYQLGKTGVQDLAVFNTQQYCGKLKQLN